MAYSDYMSAKALHWKPATSSAYGSTRIRTTTTFELDSPGEGLEWDTTDIEDGIVRVKLSTSVNDIHADEEVACEAFTIGGAHVGSFTCARKDIRCTLKQSGALRAPTW